MNDDAVFAKCVRRLIPFIFVLYLVNFIDRVNVGFAALTMNADLGFSPAVFGLGGGIFFLGYSLFQIPANLILDRVGARRWIFLILLVWGAVSASTAFITNATEFYAVRILLGIAEAGFFPGMVLYLTYWFPKAYRARLVSNFMLAIPFANIVGGPVSGLILGMDGIGGLHGWQWLFLIEGTPACAIAFAVLAWLPSGPGDAPWLSAEEKLSIAARLASDESVHHHKLLRAFLDPKVWALGVVYLGYAISYYGVQLWLPQIVQAMGFSNLATSFLVALPFVATMFAMIFWSRSSDSSGERIWHVAIPALVGMASLIAASIAASNLLIFLALTVAVVSLMSLQGPFWALPQTYLGGVAAAGGIALINTLGTGAGGFVGPYVVGVLKSATGGYAVPIGVLAIAPAMTAIVVLSLKTSVATKTAESSARLDLEDREMPDKNTTAAWLREIIDILNREWDPIGVISPDEEWPDDEYQGYAGKLAAMLRAEATNEELMTYIERAEIENMGLSPPFDRVRAQNVITTLRALAIPT